MNCRTSGFGLLLAASLSCPLSAQTNGDLQPIFDRIDRLESRLEQSMEKQFAEVKTHQNNLTTEITKANEQIDQLKQDLLGVQRDYSDLLERLDQVTEQGSQGEWNLKVLGNMQDRPEFRQQMQKAVNESISPEGKVIVTNFMDTWQRIVVNGEARWVPPSAGREEVFAVKVGTVTTVIPGFEGQKNWTLTAPRYEQRIDIVPRHTAAYAPSEQAAPAEWAASPVHTANFGGQSAALVPVVPNNSVLIPIEPNWNGVQIFP